MDQFRAKLLSFVWQSVEWTQFNWFAYFHITFHHKRAQKSINIGRVTTQWQRMNGGINIFFYVLPHTFWWGGPDGFLPPPEMLLHRSANQPFAHPLDLFLIIPFEILKITSRWNLLRRNVCSFLDKKIEGLENFEKLPCTVTSTCLCFRIVFCIAAILFRTFFCQILSGSGRKKWSGVLLSNFTIRRIDK